MTVGNDPRSLKAAARAALMETQRRKHLEAEFMAAVRAVVRPRELLAIDALLETDIRRRLAHQHFMLSASVSPIAIAAGA